MRRCETSKIVGFQGCSNYPTIEEVQDAIRRKDAVSILSWNRFLPSPMTDEHVEIINLVVDGMSKVFDD